MKLFISFAGPALCRYQITRSGLGLPPPSIPPHKGEGDFDILHFFGDSISSTKFARKNSMLVSPSPLWGGIEGGGKPSHKTL